jgi:maltose-binding protein MalE
VSFASGTSLNVLCEAGGHLELTPIANLFKTTTGHTVNLAELPYNGLYDRVYSELSTGSVTFDILAGDAIWIPTFAPGLVKLDSFFTPAVKADLFPVTLQEAQYRGTYYGVPQWTNVEILRALDKPSLSEAQRLALYRAFHTTGLELMERADDSYGNVDQMREEAWHTYLKLDWQAAGMKPEGYGPISVTWWCLRTTASGSRQRHAHGYTCPPRRRK